jgi:hypothetical protein
MKTNLLAAVGGLALITLPALFSGCSSAGPDGASSAATEAPPGTAEAIPFTQAEIYEHRIVDIQKYLTEHPELSIEQAVAHLHRPIKLEPGHFLYPRDLQLPERCSTSLDTAASGFVADFETCIVKPSLFDPASDEMVKMAERYLELTGQVLEVPGGDGPPTIWVTGRHYSSCYKSYNCKNQSKIGTKCEVKFFSVEFGCSAYVEIYQVCDVCWGTQTCTDYENSDGGSFSICGECVCGR